MKIKLTEKPCSIYPTWKDSDCPTEDCYNCPSFYNITPGCDGVHSACCPTEDCKDCPIKPYMTVSDQCSNPSRAGSVPGRREPICKEPIK